MSLRNLYLFTMVAMVVASATVANDAGFVPDRSASYPVGELANMPVLSALKAVGAQSGISAAVLDRAQSRDADKLGVGKLLVASRDLGDPHFAETVVLLVHYDAEGVVGLILNRRTDLPISRALEGVKAAKDRSDPVYAGGPVEIPTVFGLLQSPAKVEGAEKVFGGVYLISTKSLFEETISAGAKPNVFHVYLGYAGWNMNQLRMEVELGSWFIFPADVKTVFDSDPDTLWSRMIVKTEQKFAKSELALAPLEENMSGSGQSGSNRPGFSIARLPTNRYRLPFLNWVVCSERAWYRGRHRDIDHQKPF